MNSPLRCQRCGTPLEGIGGDYCPACLLRQGLGSTTDSLPPHPAPPSPPPVFGAYELFEEIGRGGMGIVYRARQRLLKRTVAIKLLAGGAYSSESLLRRFQLEAESAAALQHPGIVAIFEFGENEHQPFYAMEYVEGKNLAEVCAGLPLPPHRAATYLQAIAAAVHYAHQRGILHRDLKPSNVLIDRDDRPRITDFGLAKQLHGRPDLSLPGQMVGSPNYSAPEQIAGRPGETDVRSDVYSLGALLYHLLTGRPPFIAATLEETMRLVFETEAIPPCTLNPDIPPDLNTICLKCLEKPPARRYASAEELSDELARFLRGEPIRARPVSSLERGWRWSRRHPGVTALAATVLLALIATSVIFYGAARRIERARLEERAAREAAEDNLYAANMQVMSRAFTGPNGADPRGMRESLNASRPREGLPDRRGFEWRYFWLRSKTDALATLSGHRHLVDNTLYSPDGSRLATHSLDGTLKLWDAAAGKELHSIPEVAVIGGFNADATQLIYSRRDQSLWRFEVATGRAAALPSPGGQLIAALADGRHVVIFGADQLPRLRSLDEAAASNPPAEIPVDTCAVVSADGRRVAVAGRPYPGILVFDLASQRQIAALIDPRPVIALALSPDGRQLVSSGFDGVLKVWNVDRGQQEHAFRAFVDPAWGLAYSTDGRSFAAGGHNRDVKIWATSDWSEKEDLRGHGSTVRSIAFSPDGQHLASGGEDDLVLLWPAQVDRRPENWPKLLRGPSWGDHTPGLAFSPDSRLFTGTAADGTIKVWRTDRAQVVASYPMEARTVAFGPDGQSVLSEAADGSIRRWMLEKEQPPTILHPKAGFANWQVDSLTPQERVTFVADQAAARAQCGLCEIPSARDGINAGAMMSTPTIAVSPDGHTMFVGLPQGSLEAWDVATRRRLYVVPAHQLNVTAVAVSADGRYLATGGLDNSTKLWEAATGRNLATFHIHNRPVWALAFSPDSQTLAAGSCDKEIILCSVPLRQYVAGLPLYDGSPQGYEQEVRLLRFSPDGNILAAALGDGSLRFFRAASLSETDPK